MDWKETDEKLIRRGELILDIGSLKNNEEELKNMNKHKRGPHFKLANSYITLSQPSDTSTRCPTDSSRDSHTPYTDSYQPSHPETTPASENASSA